MNAVRTFFRELTLKPQGLTVVIAAFLPIIAIVAMGPAVPTMIEHFANDPEARAKVPAMIGAPGLAMALLAPFAGLLVDRFGRRRLLLLCTALYGVFGSAPLLLDDLDQIYYSRLLLGVSEAGILTVVNTLIGDYWDDRGRKNWLFLQGLLGPFIAGIIALIVGFATTLQWNGVFFVYLIAFPIWAAMFVWVFEPKRTEADEEVAAEVAPSGAFPWGNAALIAAVTLFASMLYYVFIINGALAFAEVGVTEPERYAGLIFVPQLFILVGAALFRLLANRGHVLQLGVFLLLLGAGLAGMGLATTASAMVAALIVQQTAAGMAVPTLIAWSQTKFDFAHRGTGMGIWTGAFFLGQSQSPRLVHAIDAQVGSMQGAFLIAGLVGIAAAGVALAPAAAAVPAAAQQGATFQFSDAARADYPGEVRLGTGPGQPREDWFRQDGSLQVRNVAEATLTPFLPPAGAGSGGAVIVAPGGAFLGLAIEEEGYRVAKWLADHGVAAFVLKYRLLPTPADPATFRREVTAVRTGKGPASFRPPETTPPEALADGIAAIRHVRANAASYGVDSARVGMMGFSAGAFTTLSVALANAPDARPAFIAPIYGRQNTVTPPPGAPPMYVVIAGDDGLFGKSGFGLVESWRQAGAPVELHLLQNGGHGFGLGKAGTTSVDWIEGFRRWLDVNGFLSSKR